MPDTSALIEGEYFNEVDWATLATPAGSPVRLVVPVLVVEEMDKLKAFDKGSQRDRARKVLRDLRHLLTAVPPGQPAVLRKNVTIEVFIDDDWHERLLNHDGEIIDQAVQVHRLTGRPVTIACLDLSMELRARLRGVDTMIIPGKRDMQSSASAPNGQPTPTTP
jgi:predicted ribonuclease YlaK